MHRTVVPCHILALARSVPHISDAVGTLSSQLGPLDPSASQGAARSLPACEPPAFRIAGKFAVVTVGDSALSPKDPSRLLRQVAGIADRVCGRIIIDVAGVPNFTCAWINALLDLHHHCRKLGGRMIVTGISQDGLALLHECGLTNRLHVAGDGDSAEALVGDGVHEQSLLRRVAGVLGIGGGRTDSKRAA